MNLNRIPYVGIFSLATDDYMIVPRRFRGVSENKISETMGTKIFQSMVSQSPLIGILSAGNKSGILVPDLIDTDEETLEEQLGVNVSIIPGKHTAIGNLVLANDNGAIVSPNLPDEAMSIIKDTLNVETERGTVAGLKSVGSAGVATNKGVLLHPDTKEEELKKIENTLKIHGDIGTALGGVKYVGACIVANSTGALTGENTTGPELGRIENSLGFI
ncbi:MAG: translation initiation factor IF-6 [Hadesarchaea archaeon]|nr:translation initiation factor IF-6 [Hadesarchaea archaeon]